MKNGEIMRIAQFEKVGFEQFSEDFRKVGAVCAYDDVRLPKRATSGSAGYDFFMPFDLVLRPGENVLVPTGVRVRMEEGWMLQLYPRSGLGTKFRLQLDNTVGIVDADYYFSQNQGHIFCKITNDSKEGKTLSLTAGQAFCQGIFVPFGITYDDCAEGKRDGGFGSTDGRRGA